MTTEHRVPLIDESTDDPVLKPLFERARGGFAGEVPNLYRTLGHAPELLEGWITFAWGLRHDAETPRAVRELVIVRAATLLGSSYERGHHVPMALAAGCTQTQIDGLDDWRTVVDRYDAGEQAALAVTDRVVPGDPITDAEWDALRSEWGERGAVEIVLTAAFYVCVARVLDGLAVPPER